ncbi:MAG: SusC/RagA family TonB-linked outer membrane protein [Bacteroidales bacterium]|nr:SusC/RagA family TonB-linked outer membrane protein [Bacteroidales bacterium]
MNLRKLLLVVSVLLASATLWAQTRTVSGTVVGTDGLAIPGAYVLVKGTTTGTVTDMDGKYKINVPSDAETLIFRIIGMVDQEQQINGRTEINATMEAENEELNEVMVVAYGTSTKGSFTGSAAVVNNETLDKRQVSNASQALAGTMAGVQVLSNNGQPGESATIRIRGVGSINASSNPLYVVDGIPFDGDLSSINTKDIESITVLKDAASTALYGARGANGIIMITTKNGRAGDMKINVEARWGSNSRSVKNYDVIKDPVEYLELEYGAVANYMLAAGVAEANLDKMVSKYITTNKYGGNGYQIYDVPKGENLFVGGKLNPNATLGYNDGEYYYTPDDWEKETFKNTLRQQYDLNMSGGNESGTYLISIGHLNDQGLIEGSGLKRATTRFKGDYQIKSWLKVGGNFSYNYVKSYYPDEQTTTNSSGNAFYIANFIAPVYPLYVRDANGNILTKNGRKVYDYGTSDEYSPRDRSFMSISNPLGDLTYNKREYVMDILSANGLAEITPFDGLVLSARYGLYIDNTRYSSLGNAYMGQSATGGGTATQGSTRQHSLDQQYIANYTKTVADDHTFDITVGYDGYQLKTDKIQGSGSHLYNPESFYLSNATTDFSISGSRSKYATKGFLSRINYSYLDKYFGNVSFRRDGSSRFAEDNRWGNFFSLSGAWIISSEDFMQGAVEWINHLKLKGSYGEQGNDNIGNNYAYEDQYELSGAKGKYSDGVLTYKGNKDITWETSISYNVGLDFAMFGNALTGTVEYFGRKSKDMLYYKPVAASNGYTQLPMNVGSMTNSGVEIELNYGIIDNDLVQWDVNANATFVKNEINELHPDLEGKLIDGSYIYEEGQSRYRMYLVDYAGVDKKTGQALYWADRNTDYGTSIKGATADYNVASNGYKVATEDLMPVVYGGFGTTARAFGFDASVAFSYQLGGQIFDSGYQRLMHAGGSSTAGQGWHKDIRKAWTPENTDTDVPQIDASTAGQYASSTSTRWLVSSNYLSLNNVTVGYTLPKDLVGKVYLGNVRVYFTADNLALFTARKGLDPRQSYTTSTTARYTPIKSISGGISITF